MVDVASEIKQSVDMSSLCSSLGIIVSRSGFCRCPFHGQDRHPSMKVYPGTRGFCCFTCGAKGSVIDFVMKYNSCKYWNAVEWLNSTFALGLPLDMEESPEERRDAEIARKQRQIERELKQAIRDELFETYLNAGDVVMRLERDKEDYRPRTAYEEWDERFVTALRLLTEAKDLAVEAGIEAIGIRE